MKSFLKRLIIIGICALSNNVYATGIPTVDVAAIAQNLMSYTAEVANYAEVLSQWKKQYDQMTQQLNTMQQQYQAITGTRNMGQFLNDQMLFRSLPPEWKSIYDNVKKTGDSLQGLKSSNDGQRIYYGTINTNVDQLTQTYTAATQRIDRLQELMGQIDYAQDVKAAQDLANRIGVEQALLQNENSRVALMIQLQQMQMQVAQEQRSAQWKDSLLNTPMNQLSK